MVRHEAIHIGYMFRYSYSRSTALCVLGYWLVPCGYWYRYCFRLSSLESLCYTPYPFRRMQYMA